MFKVVMNASHSLLSSQISLLGGEGNFEIVTIPGEGLTLPQIEDLVGQLAQDDFEDSQSSLVVLSPIPALLAGLARKGVPFSVLHNDRREAKEIPDGKGGVKLIHVIAKEGWVLY